MGDSVCQWDWRGCNITVTLGPAGGPGGYLYVMWDGRGSCTLGCNGGKKKFESRCGVFLSASIVSHAGGYVNQHFRGGLIYNVGLLPSEKIFLHRLHTPVQLSPQAAPHVKGRDEMELDREKILEALERAALSKPNDAVMLALEPKEQYVPGLDLWGVSEFKVSSTGAVEVKFADRVKAISLLLECAGGGEEGMKALLDALEGDGA